MLDLLNKAGDVATLIFVVSSMLGVGAGLLLGQIIEPLRDVRLVALGLVANFILMPLGALVLAWVLRLDQEYGIGLLVLGCAAGAPFLPKLAEFSKGNLPFGVGLMVLLMVITVANLPVALPLLLHGVTVDPVKIARSLFLLMLLPLGVGLFFKARLQAVAARVKPWADWLSNIALVLLIVLIGAANIDKVLEVFGTRAILAGLLFIAFGFCVGWFLGGPGSDTRRVLALGTAQRNTAAALVVANQSLHNPKILVMLIVVAIIGLVTTVPSARVLAKRVPYRDAGAVRTPMR
jgi:bile acid:Na+ symporter, BASS family